MEFQSNWSLWSWDVLKLNIGRFIIWGFGDSEIRLGGATRDIGGGVKKSGVGQLRLKIWEGGTGPFVPLLNTPWYVKTVKLTKLILIWQYQLAGLFKILKIYKKAYFYIIILLGSILIQCYVLCLKFIKSVPNLGK